MDLLDHGCKAISSVSVEILSSRNDVQRAFLRILDHPSSSPDDCDWLVGGYLVDHTTRRSMGLVELTYLPGIVSW